MSLLDPETGLALDDKQSATLISNFFVSLTKVFPPIKSEWLDLQCPEIRTSSMLTDGRFSGRCKSTTHFLLAGNL